MSMPIMVAMMATTLFATTSLEAALTSPGIFPPPPPNVVFEVLPPVVVVGSPLVMIVAVDVGRTMIWDKEGKGASVSADETVVGLILELVDDLVDEVVGPPPEGIVTGTRLKPAQVVSKAVLCGFVNEGREIQHQKTYCQQAFGPRIS